MLTKNLRHIVEVARSNNAFYQADNVRMMQRCINCDKLESFNELLYDMRMLHVNNNAKVIEFINPQLAHVVIISVMKLDGDLAESPYVWVKITDTDTNKDVEFCLTQNKKFDSTADVIPDIPVLF